MVIISQLYASTSSFRLLMEKLICSKANAVGASSMRSTRALYAGRPRNESCISSFLALLCRLTGDTRVTAEHSKTELRLLLSLWKVYMVTMQGPNQPASISRELQAQSTHLHYLQALGMNAAHTCKYLRCSLLMSTYIQSEDLCATGRGLLLSFIYYIRIESS